MRQGRVLLAAGFAAMLVLPLAARPAAAVGSSPSPSPNPATIDAQLKQAETELAQLEGELKSTQARLDVLNRQLAADQQREAELQQQISGLARLEYQQPVYQLNSLLSARSLDQLLADFAQARLVSSKQRDLVTQATQLRKQDQSARDKVAEQVTQIEAARSKAADVAAQALGIRDSARARALATQAGRLACDPSQPAPAGCPPGSIQQIIAAAFAPQGQAAIDWGLRIARCESTYNPRAVNPSGAEGLFQFMPSTFANTPPGRAGASIWDPVAQSQAAAWMYSQGRQYEWQCN